MELIGQGLIAIGEAIGDIAAAIGMIYIVGIVTKTFLIFMDKVEIEDLKDWFKFGIWDGFGRKGL